MEPITFNIDLWLTIALIIFGAGSEILSLLNIKPNSWLQLIVEILKALKSHFSKSGGS